MIHLKWYFNNDGESHYDGKHGLMLGDNAWGCLNIRVHIHIHVHDNHGHVLSNTYKKNPHCISRYNLVIYYIYNLYRYKGGGLLFRKKRFMLLVKFFKICQIFGVQKPPFSSLMNSLAFLLNSGFVLSETLQICHILYTQKPKVAFSIFHFVLFYFFP